MKRLLHKTPPWIQKLYPNFIWQVPTKKKELFLTFDDGPIPEVTDFVLKELVQYKAKGTFFSVGDNLIKNRSIAERIVKDGHVLGNHTQNHLKGWEHGNFSYWRNILECEQNLNSLQSSQGLFRPPYGRIKRAQANALQDFKIIMWNRLAWDFGKNLNTEQAIKHLTDDAPAGSIFVFHDNLKSFENLKKLLPEVLAYYSKRGFTFSALTRDKLA